MLIEAYGRKEDKLSTSISSSLTILKPKQLAMQSFVMGRIHFQQYMIWLIDWMINSLTFSIQYIFHAGVGKSVVFVVLPKWYYYISD